MMTEKDKKKAEELANSHSIRILAEAMSIKCSNTYCDDCELKKYDPQSGITFCMIEEEVGPADWNLED